jgi:hypothetical protein
MDPINVANMIGGAGVVVLSLYTYYTRKMQRAVSRQLELANQQTDLLRLQNAASSDLVKLSQMQAAEVAHQTRLTFMPVFVAEIVQEHHEPRPGLSDFGYRFKLTNVGRGTALEVRIEDVHVPHQKAPLAPEGEVRDYFLNARLVFSALPFVQPDQDKPTTLEHRFLTGDDEYPLDLIIYLLGKHGGDREFDIWIRFSDVEGNKYKQLVRAGVGGCRPGAVRLESEERPTLAVGNPEETKTEGQQCQSISITQPAGSTQHSIKVMQAPDSTQ